MTRLAIALSCALKSLMGCAALQRCQNAQLPLALLLALILAPACAPPPDGTNIGVVVRSVLVKDSYLFEVAQAIRVYVIKASSGGNLLACSDMRGAKFDPDKSSYDQLVTPAPGVSLQGHDPNKEVVIPNFDVPAGERFILVARALTQYADGVFPVGHGCKDDLIIEAAATKLVDIDVTATTGSDCGEVGDCPLGLGCQYSADKNSPFWGGYCAKTDPCNADSDCPPGSSCISNGSSTICLRGCKTLETINDCTTVSGGQANQICVGRKGPTAKGCAPVCISPVWNTAGKCTP